MSPVTKGSVLVTKGSATRVFGALAGGADQEPGELVTDAYVAPEGQWATDLDRRRLDVFALAAVSYLVLTGRPPGTSATDVRSRLTRDRGLDLVADLPAAPSALRDLILEASRPAVSDRLRDVGAFLTKLADVERELGRTAEGTETDPLEATPGTLIGSRFELVRRLGSGSTAVGLLVDDKVAAGRRVLKVAIDDSAAKRLGDEAEVLTALGARPHPRLVRLVEPEPLQVGTRTALLLDFAGDETLAEVMRERRRMSLDLLERWGTDLLEALVALDEASVDHRDIKPSNLGVREQRSDRAKHLVLFDFSLSKASAGTITAGTPPYLDPFLGTGARQNWDSAAERYAVAVTLFEMATGHTPVYGDGQTNPAVIEDEATVDTGDFDPAVAEPLTRMFKRALLRDARARHHTAADMLAAWRATLSADATTIPDDADATADAATADTPLAESGLSARALSALEPFALATAGDLATLDTSKLSRFSGVVMVTRDEIRRRARQWRERFGADLTPPSPTEPVGTPGDPWLDPAGTVAMLVQAAGSPRAQTRRDAAARMLGTVGDAPAFGTLGELARSLGLGGQPQVSQTLAKIRDSWADDQVAAAALDEVERRVVDLVTQLDGVAWADAVVDAACHPSTTPHDRRLIAGLIRAALDRSDDKARGAEEPPRISRRRRRSDGQVLLALSVELLEVAPALAERAAGLVTEAAVLGDVVVPLGRSGPGLRELYTAVLPPLDDIRLVRLAARLSGQVAASPRGELFDRAMPATDAVRLALGGVSASQRLTVEEVHRWVSAKFPGLASLPRRPALDDVLTAAATGLLWDGGAYCVPSIRSDTSLVPSTSVTDIPVGRAMSAVDHPDAVQLRKSVIACSFLALGVRDSYVDRMADAIVRGFRATTVNVTDVLVSTLKTEAEQASVPWELVLAADAAEPGSRDAEGLAALVRRSLPTLEQAVNDAMSTGAPATTPVLLTEAAPLARYGHLDLLTRLADIAQKRRQAVWLLLPLGADKGAQLDGVPVPLSYASQFVTLDPAITRALSVSPPLQGALS